MHCIPVFHSPVDETLWFIPMIQNTVLLVYLFGNPENSKTSPYLKPFTPSTVNDASNGMTGAFRLTESSKDDLGY